jgi:hypothetical protein
MAAHQQRALEEVAQLFLLKVSWKIRHLDSVAHRRGPLGDLAPKSNILVELTQIAYAV